MSSRGERLKFAIEARGFEKQFALAFELGVHQSAITRWKENGPISLASAMKLCVVLDVSMDWLLLERGAFDQHKKTDVASDPAASPDIARLHRAIQTLRRPIIDRLVALAEAISTMT